MALEKWAEGIALRAQEAATQLSHSDICKSLCDALKSVYPGQYVYPADIYGDDSSGDVVYYCGGDYMRAPYEIQTIDGKRACSIDTSQAVDVLPRTVYDEEADEDEHFASMDGSENEEDDAMESAREKYVERFPGSKDWKFATFAERFISKSERDAADSGSFAGKGKSFPILKPGDVMAAVRSMGRAGAANKSTGALKSSIIRIAKRKGWAKYLPKAWQSGGGDDGAKEAADIEITGDIVTLREGAVGQDGSAYLKLISPGWGSSGFYSKEVLKRDGPAIFKAGTKNFWNHPTAQEEAARPEGDLRDLASVLTEDAHYEENGPAGAGLYARATVQPHFREHVDSLSKHIGMSIRAAGKAREGKADGKAGPIIEQLTRGISVDYVTTPGAGGKVLQLFEAARPRPNSTHEGETDMDEATVKRLISEALTPFAKKAKENDAPKLKKGKTIRRMLEGIRMPDAYRKLIIERVRANWPITEAGATDETRLKAIVEKQLRKVSESLSRETGQVVNLGASQSTGDTKAIEAASKEHDEAFAASLRETAEIFMDVNEQTPEDVAKRRLEMFRKGRAA